MQSSGRSGRFPIFDREYEKDLMFVLRRQWMITADRNLWLALQATLRGLLDIISNVKFRRSEEFGCFQMLRGNVFPFRKIWASGDRGYMFTDSEIKDTGV